MSWLEYPYDIRERVVDDLHHEMVWKVAGEVDHEQEDDHGHAISWTTFNQKRAEERYDEVLIAMADGAIFEYLTPDERAWLESLVEEETAEWKEKKARNSRLTLHG